MSSGTFRGIPLGRYPQGRTQVRRTADPGDFPEASHADRAIAGRSRFAQSGVRLQHDHLVGGGLDRRPGRESHHGGIFGSANAGGNQGRNRPPVGPGADGGTCRDPARPDAGEFCGGAGRSFGRSDPDDPTITDPNLRALILLIERLTGHKVHLSRLADVPTDAAAAAQQAGDRAAAALAAASQGTAAAPQKAGWGVEVQTEQVHRETETTDFTAAGQVVTGDGRTISFDYRLGMHRDLTQTATADLQFGDAVKKVDPIALNLTGGPVALSSERSGFDIDSDGAAEQVALPASGTYFLALDRNGNGTIDNGNELFGPATGNGFTELASLDADGNGWIDGGDAAYARLKLWDGAGGALKSLADAGVGALYVGASAPTQFDLRSAANETMGQVVSSSVYLGETGTPGTIAQVDLTA